MAVIKVKPTTPGRRQMTYDDFSDITKTEPEKRLVIFRKQKSGRNSQGKITVRHRGGGARRYVRIVDFKRDKFDIPAKVAAIEYDPSRGARLALLHYADGEKRYIIAPVGLEVGVSIMSSKKELPVKPGNTMPLEYMPAGIFVHNVELQPGQGAKLARGAGNAISIMGILGKYAQLRLPSKEVRLVKKECLSTVGQVSNPEHNNINYGKAGRRRYLGFRPTVRGSAMNPVDHPHGGGEGNQPIGLRHPKTPWGKPALGVRTRNKKKSSSRLIIKRRGKKR
ncbi:MAG: 50S ribosomal protein L2 [Patescibacteria group bacterium]|jgi:large subunit ribosomal protein L2